MKWLTLDWIKAHSRIDFDCEDDLLELYGDAAEETVLNTIRRSYIGTLWKYGGFPKALIQASLLLVDLSYHQRSPISQLNMYTVPYSFDLLVKPYMRLAGEEEDDKDLPFGALITSDGKVLCERHHKVLNCTGTA